MSTDAAPAAARTTWRRSPFLARSARYAAGVALIVGGYYAATKASEALLLAPGEVGVVWLATGVGVAALYLGG